MASLTADEGKGFLSRSSGNDVKRERSEGESKSVVEVTHSVAFFLKVSIDQSP